MSHYLVPVAVLMVVGAIVVLAAGVMIHPPALSGARVGSHAVARKLPPYWRVRPGETLGLIAKKTGLTISQLEAFNPSAAPDALFPGERLNLWRHPPTPRGKPSLRRPRFWLVRPGQSFGSIAAKTGIDIGTLEQLNPGLKPSTVQAGDRVRLRR